MALAGLCAYVSAHGAAALEESAYRKPVRLIVPFAPGDTNDILGRMIATDLGARLGRTFIVDNRPGADGAIGTEYVLKANPDGHTLIVLSAAYAMNPAVRKLPYDPQTAVEFIIGLGSGPTVLSVGPSLQVDSANALFSVAKSKPGQVIFSTSGGFQHFATALLQTLSGQQFNIVLYRARPRPWSMSSAVRRTRASRPSCRPNRISSPASLSPLAMGTLKRSAMLLICRRWTSSA